MFWERGLGIKPKRPNDTQDCKLYQSRGPSSSLGENCTFRSGGISSFSYICFWGQLCSTSNPITSYQSFFMGNPSQFAHTFCLIPANDTWWCLGKPQLLVVPFITPVDVKSVSMLRYIYFLGKGSSISHRTGKAKIIIFKSAGWENDTSVTRRVYTHHHCATVRVCSKKNTQPTRLKVVTVVVVSWPIAIINPCKFANKSPE